MKNDTVRTLQLNILCLATGKWTTQKQQRRRYFQGKILTEKSLQQANVTELMETMLVVFILRVNDQ